MASCYSQGDGREPPLDQFYFPVGLQVSHGGSVLYVANSDFDLQYNGGTLQSFDLNLIRRHALDVIDDPSNPNLPWVRPPPPAGACPSNAPTATSDTGSRQPLGETCAPPVRSEFYQRDSAVIGAFATDMVLSAAPTVPTGSRPRAFDRLFVPVRGNATLTWTDVVRDDPAAVPPDSHDPAAYAPWRLDCGQTPTSRRCDARHQVGEDPDEVGNTRKLKMPGEPFGIALSDDGRSAAITHQDTTQTSLFLTGLGPNDSDASQSGVGEVVPSLQFVLDGVALGGMGLVSVPHDPEAFVGQAPPFPAFLETNRTQPQIELLRQYPDEAVDVATLPDGGTQIPGGAVLTPSTLRRPFLTREGTFPIPASPSGLDSRGIAIDPTPRLACKAKATTPAEQLACARKPSRLFVANRSPASLLIGEVGGTSAATGAYDPDLVTIFRSEPLSAGPSRVYLAPIVDKDGAYSLRVFVVCFDAAQVFVFDPDAGRLENVIRVGPGPSVMAFDPFDMAAVARHDKVELDTRVGRGLTRYRFAYVASYTQSYLQLLDLDRTKASTFESVVFTLGLPTSPKGT